MKTIIRLEDIEYKGDFVDVTKVGVKYYIEVVEGAEECQVELTKEQLAQLFYAIKDELNID